MVETLHAWQVEVTMCLDGQVRLVSTTVTSASSYLATRQAMLDVTRQHGRVHPVPLSVTRVK